MGGPSGGCIPAAMCDLPIDYQQINRTGAIMGSGGLVVMDETTCMVDVARYFLTFTQAESCGKCTFCRIGTKRMLEILERICSGEGTMEDLDNLDELSAQIKSASLCGLGQTAPNPVVTTLKYFRDEYVAHIVDKKCPSHVCTPLLTYSIKDNCTGCTVCARACPSEAIAGDKKQIHVIDQDKCIKCGKCFDVCRFDAVLKD
jgi:NADH-quinone oxidoreductase subunit F